MVLHMLLHVAWDLFLLFWDSQFVEKYFKIDNDLVPVARICEIIGLDDVKLEEVNTYE